MKYLTLSADYLDYSLQDDLGLPADRMLIPPEVRSELEAWNAEYQPIVTLSRDERASQETLDKIMDLDSRGVSLGVMISASIPDAPKVTYYSEGLLRRLQ